MTKLKVLFICLVLGALPIAACGTAATPEPTATATAEPPTPTPAPDLAAIADEFIADLNAKDAEAAAELLTEDAIFALHERFQRHTHPEPFVGVDEILEFWQSDAWSAISIEPGDFEAEDGRVVYPCRIFSGEAMVSYGSPASNSACVLLFDGGLISFVGDQATETLYPEQ